MTIEESIIEKLRSLPVDKQREVLDFVEFLHSKAKTRPSKRRLKGL